ncbi:MAG: hypothetical protein IPJ58_09565 [Ardenticatenia bacterium]|nr:hypothetical protein [Ardenticatenia bacterium]
MTLDHGYYQPVDPESITWTIVFQQNNRAMDLMVQTYHALHPAASAPAYSPGVIAYLSEALNALADAGVGRRARCCRLKPDRTAATGFSATDWNLAMSDSQPVRYDAPDPDALSRLRDNFLNRLDGFRSFVDRSGVYWDDERECKDLLVELYRAHLRGLLHDGLWDTVGARELVAEVRRVLTSRLSDRHGPQNLLNWRLFDFLARMSSDQTLVFAGAFYDLLRGPGDSSERMERFNAAFAPIVAPASPAVTRSFPTLFLMLDRPDENIYVRTELYESAHRQLYGVPLFANAPLSAAEYRAVRAMAAALWTALAGWGWQPADMIDVHSFTLVRPRCAAAAESRADRTHG